MLMEQSLFSYINKRGCSTVTAPFLYKHLIPIYTKYLFN